MSTSEQIEILLVVCSQITQYEKLINKKVAILEEQTKI